MTYTRIEMEKAERLYNGLTAEKKRTTTIDHLAHVYRTISIIGQEIGIYPDVNRVWHLADEEIRAEAERLAKKSKKRAGVKALVKKYGHAAAERILENKTGRHINIR